jgi:hypothetical protein
MEIVFSVGSAPRLYNEDPKSAEIRKGNLESETVKYDCAGEGHQQL